MAEEAEKGNKALKFVGKMLVKAFTLAAGFIIGGYIGSLIFDPFFFPVIHDVNNATSQALIDFLKDKFGVLHDLAGLTGDGGFLKSEFVQNTLGLRKYYKETPAERAMRRETDVSALDTFDNSGDVDSLINQLAGGIPDAANDSAFDAVLELAA